MPPSHAYRDEHTLRVGVVLFEDGVQLGNVALAKGKRRRGGGEGRRGEGMEREGGARMREEGRKGDGPPAPGARADEMRLFRE